MKHVDFVKLDNAIEALVGHGHHRLTDNIIASEIAEADQSHITQDDVNVMSSNGLYLNKIRSVDPVPKGGTIKGIDIDAIRDAIRNAVLARRAQNERSAKEKVAHPEQETIPGDSFQSDVASTPAQDQINPQETTGLQLSKQPENSCVLLTENDIVSETTQELPTHQDTNGEQSDEQPCEQQYFDEPTEIESEIPTESKESMCELGIQIQQEITSNTPLTAEPEYIKTENVVKKNPSAQEIVSLCELGKYDKNYFFDQEKPFVIYNPDHHDKASTMYASGIIDVISVLQHNPLFRNEVHLSPKCQKAKDLVKGKFSTSFTNKFDIVFGESQVEVSNMPLCKECCQITSIPSATESPEFVSMFQLAVSISK